MCNNNTIIIDSSIELELLLYNNRKTINVGISEYTLLNHM